MAMEATDMHVNVINRKEVMEPQVGNMQLGMLALQESVEINTNVELELAKG